MDQRLRLANLSNDNYNTLNDLDVLPVLLEERDEEVNGELHVLDELLLVHTAVADGHVEAEHLLQLELDRRLHLVHLGREVLLLHDERGKFARLVEAGAEQTRDLLDQRLRREEIVVLLGCGRGTGGSDVVRQASHYTASQVLQPVRVLEVEAERGSLLAVEGVAQHAYLHLRSRDVWQLDVAGETLVLLRIVVLQANLQLNRLKKTTLLLLRPLQHLVDACANVRGLTRHMASPSSPAARAPRPAAAAKLRRGLTCGGQARATPTGVP
eukprot:scaffold7583_cov118-Isochrysis_galbana.AAC.3